MAQVVELFMKHKALGSIPNTEKKPYGSIYVTP
jgi:hypothetical protein